MPESLYPQVNVPISLKSFIEFLDHSDIIPALKRSDYNQKHFEIVAEKLAQSALNRNFLTDRLCSELKQFETFQSNNTFKPSTLLIHKGEGYTIRAVIWMPVAERYPAEIFSYFEPHDHNFDFFTINYFGPGYTTHIYSYDYDQVKGVPGEVVELQFSEKTCLTQGKVMYYYGSHDAHIQYPPESLTVSLNVILPKTKPAHRRQYEFEFIEGNKAKLAEGKFDRLQRQRTLINVASHLGDETSLDLIRQIALTHDNVPLRAIAWKAVLSNPMATSNDFEKASHDTSNHVHAVLSEFKTVE